METLLNRLQELGLTAAVEKCVFCVNVIDFYGMRFSENGMEPNPEKVEALKNAEPPTNVTELKSFLGMTNYSNQFIKNYAHKTAKLR